MNLTTRGEREKTQCVNVQTKFCVAFVLNVVRSLQKNRHRIEKDFNFPIYFGESSELRESVGKVTRMLANSSVASRNSACLSYKNTQVAVH